VAATFAEQQLRAVKVRSVFGKCASDSEHIWFILQLNHIQRPHAHTQSVCISAGSVHFQVLKQPAHSWDTLTMRLSPAACEGVC
jgi:hypothetical protein